MPYRVVINEGVELAKKFGATEGHKFINAVLDRAAPLRCANGGAGSVAARRIARLTIRAPQAPPCPSVNST